MTVCVMKSCNNSSNKKNQLSDVTFHKFPSDPVIASRWIKSVRLSRNDEYWTPKKQTKICSVHFNDEDRYITTGGLFRLRREAVPIKNFLVGTNQQGPRKNIVDNESLRSQNFQVSQLSSSFVNSQEDRLQSVTNTPREVLLRKELDKRILLQLKYAKLIKTLKQKTCRPKTKNKSLRNILVLLRRERYIDNDIFNILSESLCAAELFNKMAKRNSQRKNRPLPKYTPGFRKFCLTLHYHSPRAYNYVRRTFNTCLPNVRKIYNWYNSVSGSPGFTDEAFKLLKSKVNSTDTKLICCLMADEMAIRPQNITGDHGDVDIGAGPSGSCVKVTDAYVFLLVCINEHWEIPLGYFLIQGLSGAQKKNLIKICLTKCAECGIKVVSFTCDGHPTNISAIELLGCQIKDTANLKTTFKHPIDDHEIAVFLDSYHMLKLIRNHFEDKKYFLNQHESAIDWTFVSKLNKLQEKDGLHISNKLTQRHLEFRNSLTKIKLVTQLLSRSVAVCLKFCREALKLEAFKESEETEKFITLFNNLFDILNSRAIIQHGFCHPLSIDNRDEIFCYLNKAKQYINNLKIKTIRKRSYYKENSATVILKRFQSVLNTNASTGFRGILVCIESLKHLYTTLIEGTHELNYIETYRLSQDQIELFFGTIRMSGGHNDNLSALQFKNAYKKHLRQIGLQTEGTRNWSHLESIPILTSCSSLKFINMTAFSERYDDTEDFPEHLQHDSFELDADVHTASVDDPNYKNYIVGYIAGYIVQFLTKEIKCTFCRDSMLAKQIEWFHKLVTLRDNGRLLYASKEIYSICIIAENCLSRYIAQNLGNISEKNLLINIMEKMIGNPLFPEAEVHINFHHHHTHLVRLIIERYLHIRMNMNESTKHKTSRRALSKRRLFKKQLKLTGY